MLLTIKSYIAKIMVQYVLPKTLEWGKEAIPALASSAMQDIIDRLNRKKDEKMSTLTIVVTDESQVAITTAKIAYTVNGIPAEKVVDSNGNALLAGLPDGSYTFTALADGYTSQSQSTNIAGGGLATVTFRLAKTVEAATADAVAKVETDAVATAAIAKASGTIVAAANAAINTTNATNIADAKAAFKAYVPTIKAQISDIEKAIAADSIESVSSLSSALIANTKVQLTSSIAWYVKQRSSIICDNGTVPAKYWVAYLEYTSMIGAMVLLRGTIASAVDAALKFIMSKVG